MKPSRLITAIALFIISSTSPALSQATTCPTGLSPGNDTVIFTVPYTYAQVLSIIGSYRNLTWSGSPYASVTLTGPDNTVGSTRAYDLAGAHVVETLRAYSKPPQGPYFEWHTVDYLTVPLPTGNVSLSSSYDATTVTPVCDGSASSFNLTVLFCASNVSVAGPLLHMLHLGDAQTVGVFLGGQNFSSCAQLATATATGVGMATATATSTPAAFTGAATRTGVEAGVVLGLAHVAAWLL